MEDDKAVFFKESSQNEFYNVTFTVLKLVILHFNSILEEIKPIGFLGIHLDQGLPWNFHINYVGNKLASGIYALRSLHKIYLSQSVACEQDPCPLPPLKNLSRRQELINLIGTGPIFDEELQNSLQQCLLDCRKQDGELRTLTLTGKKLPDVIINISTPIVLNAHLKRLLESRESSRVYGIKTAATISIPAPDTGTGKIGKHECGMIKELKLITSFLINEIRVRHTTCLVTG
ncbi:hypothetical protein J6590_090173 [Homalodisca vitripennis]|nr:hypothetical protein J6590_090173 [Homalodisca vitripennis]